MSDPRRESIEALFHAHYARLCAFVRRVVDSPEIAEEVVQDLFLRLWEQQESDYPPLLTKAYLYRAARNHAIDHLRRRRRERQWLVGKTLEPPSLASDADEDLRNADLARAIDAAIARLPDRCREIFLLHRQQELSYAEIAQALGLSIKTIETQMGRALKSLRLSLKDFVALGAILLLGK